MNDARLKRKQIPILYCGHIVIKTKFGAIPTCTLKIIEFRMAISKLCTSSYTLDIEKG